MAVKGGVRTGSVRVEFRSGRSYFIRRAVAFTFVFAGVLALLVVLLPSPLLAVLAAVFGAYLLLFGVSPLTTVHWLTRSRLVLRQGWYFKAVVRLRDVTDCRPYDGAAFVGLRAMGGTLFVTGGTQGLVAVELRTPRRFPQVWFASARHIVFDVEDREAFLRAYAARAASLAPVEADRPDAELRN